MCGETCDWREQMKKKTKLTIGLLSGISSLAIIGGVTASITIAKKNNTYATTNSSLNENFNNQLSSIHKCRIKQHGH